MYPGVYVREEPTGVRSIEAVGTALTAFVGHTPSGPLNEATPITSFAEFEAEFGGLSADSALGYAVRDFFVNGGQRALVVRMERGADVVGDADAGTGLFALSKSEVGLVCLPPPVADGEFGSWAADVWDRASAWCEQHRAFLVMDSPAEWTSVAEAHQGVTDLGASSPNAAVYFPWIVQPDPLRDDEKRAFAPCGAVAGIIAHTDGRRGVWKAPAGTDASVTSPAAPQIAISDAEQDVLNPEGINCLRVFPGHGCVVWGARTRTPSDAEWKYVPVRRTALFVEESLYRGLQWVVFEPNDEPLWGQIRLSVGAFMHPLFRAGAFQGATAKDAYFVKCDRETTTQADIDQGLLNVLVGFAPLKPAEFVILRIQVQAAAGGA